MTRTPAGADAGAARGARHLLLGVAVAVSLVGCALPGATDGTAVGDTELGLTLLRALPLPGGSAHANLQHGRVVRAANLFEPFCQLEVNQVSAQRRQLGPGRYRVTRVTTRLLRDPITRVPALFSGFDCDDGLFQESTWRLAPADAAASPDARLLRCIAPYFHCSIGPPLSLDQVQQVVGDYMGVGVAAAAVEPDRLRVQQGATAPRD